MQENDNASYFMFRRAEQEEEAARLTTNALAASVHLSLARRYRARANEGEEGTRVRPVRD